MYFTLQEEIIKGIVRPGSRLVISQIAKHLNVSDIPVREALQMLAHEGYVLLNPHSGYIVSSLSEDDIRQIFEIRIQLEGLAARLAVEHLSDSHIKTLKQMVNQSETFLEVNDLEGYGQFNRSFHEFIYQHANNQRLAMTIGELWDFSTRYPAFFKSQKDIEISMREHQEMVEALMHRDHHFVEQLMRDHTTRTYQQIIQSVQQMQLEGSGGLK
ncbi:GntR family transcriptional regulator [Alicyclobacillus tolerans]|uniref:GntR family transcriptional regulator n=1 Tax=Alicyclobacillus tolerans TaxID=90970 RepID=UPI001F3D58BE|nr:GntR family transcriptional regulator [Alicyclobacillus tolerans]MCF8565574.1 GntR family transcriptional regulator [Alicyclobacillus tolerans]